MAGSMKKNYLGIAISVIVHVSIVLPLMAASFIEQDRSVKVVEIDFSLTGKASPSGGFAPKAGDSAIEKKPHVRKPGRALKSAEPDWHVKQHSAAIPVKEKTESDSVPIIVTASDSQSEVVVRGTPATYSDSSGPEIFLRGQGGSAGGSEGSGGGFGVGRGKGSGTGTGTGGETTLEEGSDYTYIRDAVMKNIEYPEWARRMGFEGKTLLSFVVLENGTTSQIKIVKSSGNRFLDDSAKEGVARTVISKKVPYRVVVRLPIAYKLRVSMYENDKNT
jgi:periplasmic protein TonB